MFFSLPTFTLKFKYNCIHSLLQLVLATSSKFLMVVSNEPWQGQENSVSNTTDRGEDKGIAATHTKGGQQNWAQRQAKRMAQTGKCYKHHSIHRLKTTCHISCCHTQQKIHSSVRNHTGEKPHKSQQQLLYVRCPGQWSYKLLTVTTTMLYFSVLTNVINNKQGELTGMTNRKGTKQRTPAYYWNEVCMKCYDLTITEKWITIFIQNTDRSSSENQAQHT